MRLAVLGCTLWLSFYTPFIDSPERQKGHTGRVIASSEIECLAGAIWAEARGEPTKGQEAVGHVILNRNASGNSDVCSVVAHPYQFSFYTRNYQWKYHAKQKEIAVRLLQEEYHGNRQDFLKGITHYTNVKVKTVWMKAFMVETVIGNHKFLREKR